MQKIYFKLINFSNTIKSLFDFIKDLWNDTYDICSIICWILNILCGIDLSVDQLTIIVFSVIVVFLSWKYYFPFYYSNATLADKFLQNSSQDKYR